MTLADATNQTVSFEMSANDVTLTATWEKAVAKAERDGAVIGYYGESNLADAFGESNDGATISLLDRVSTGNMGLNLEASAS